MLKYLESMILPCREQSVNLHCIPTDMFQCDRNMLTLSKLKSVHFVSSRQSSDSFLLGVYLRIYVFCKLHGFLFFVQKNEEWHLAEKLHFLKFCRNGQSFSLKPKLYRCLYLKLCILWDCHYFNQWIRLWD